MRKVTCMCESSFDADLPEEIDLDAEPGKLDEILAGDFFRVSCPSCGASLKPELRVRLTSKKRGLDLVVLPELERTALYRGAADLPKGAQTLVGYAELYERARAWADELDPEVLEMLKYWLLAKAQEGAPEAELSAAYEGRESGKLRFHITGLREGELALLRVGQELYDKTAADKARSLRSEPFDRIFAGPYRSVRALEYLE
ncbi:MAG TPA: CpXC domain-containing protein [Spirochaetia bacterium]|nr:CpXC domain-containing protein [Spirochaetia bacterium]